MNDSITIGNLTLDIEKAFEYRQASTYGVASSHAAGRGKDLYDNFNEKVGVYPKRFKKAVYKFTAEIIDSINQKHIKSFGWGFNFKRRKAQIKGGNVIQLIKTKNILDECLDDGTYNVAPFVFSFNKTLPQLKEDFGKSKWKKVCKNSFTRNKLISSVFNRIGDLSSVIEMPSTNLSSGDVVYNGQEYKQFCRQNKLKLLNKHRITWNDAIQMAEKLGKKFKAPNNPVLLSLLHDKYTKLINEQKYSNEPFKGIHRYDFKLDGYEIKQLISPLDLVNEGKVMHHCVASYKDKAEKGQCTILSIKHCDSEEVSTLELDERGRVIQHRGKCNKSVENWDESLSKSLKVQYLTK